MNLSIKMPRGTRDVLPPEAAKWQQVEGQIRALMSRFGYGEIRTPTFEQTELFERGVGDTTDVVQKEMYTFTDKGGRSMTLRPEGTASVVRSLLENGLYAGTLPQKLFYFVNCFRYEKPQAGRLREFHQFGVEVFGADSPAADAEVISIAHALFTELKIIDQIKLTVNSIGCPDCRKAYHEHLKRFFEERRDELCATCGERLDKNPMRIFDCKSPVCQAIAAEAPLTIDYLCDGCKTHFEQLQRILLQSKISYEINPRLVRGLDYYTKTVFEFVSENIGAQGTVCGGGRYDGLVNMLGGVQLSGLGFGMGLERLLLILEAAGFTFNGEAIPEIYIAAIGERATAEAFALTTALRAAGLSAETDLTGRSLKAQMKYADKIGAQFSMVLGDDECDSGRAKLKNMKTGDTVETALCDVIKNLKIARGKK